MNVTGMAERKETVTGDEEPESVEEPSDNNLTERAVENQEDPEGNAIEEAEALTEAGHDFGESEMEDDGENDCDRTEKPRMKLRSDRRTHGSGKARRAVCSPVIEGREKGVTAKRLRKPLAASFEGTSTIDARQLSYDLYQASLSVNRWAKQAKRDQKILADTEMSLQHLRKHFDIQDGQDVLAVLTERESRWIAKEDEWKKQAADLEAQNTSFKNAAWNERALKEKFWRNMVNREVSLQNLRSRLDVPDGKDILEVLAGRESGWTAKENKWKNQVTDLEGQNTSLCKALCSERELKEKSWKALEDTETKWKDLRRQFHIQDSRDIHIVLAERESGWTAKENKSKKQVADLERQNTSLCKALCSERELKEKSWKALKDTEAKWKDLRRQLDIQDGRDIHIVLAGRESGWTAKENKWKKQVADLEGQITSLCKALCNERELKEKSWKALEDTETKWKDLRRQFHIQDGRDIHIVLAERESGWIAKESDWKKQVVNLEEQIFSLRKAQDELRKELVDLQEEHKFLYKAVQDERDLKDKFWKDYQKVSDEHDWSAKQFLSLQKKFDEQTADVVILGAKEISNGQEIIALKKKNLGLLAKIQEVNAQLEVMQGSFDQMETQYLLTVERNKDLVQHRAIGIIDAVEQFEIVRDGFMKEFPKVLHAIETMSSGKVHAEGMSKTRLIVENLDTVVAHVRRSTDACVQVQSQVAWIKKHVEKLQKTPLTLIIREETGSRTLTQADEGSQLSENAETGDGVTKTITRTVTAVRQTEERGPKRQRTNGIHSVDLSKSFQQVATVSLKDPNDPSTSI